MYSAIGAIFWFGGRSRIGSWGKIELESQLVIVNVLVVI